MTEALGLLQPGDPDRGLPSDDLAAHPSKRYKQLRKMEDLDEAIILNRGALELCPPDHPNYFEGFDNLAAVLSELVREARPAQWRTSMKPSSLPEMH